MVPSSPEGLYGLCPVDGTPAVLRLSVSQTSSTLDLLLPSLRHTKVKDISNTLRKWQEISDKC
jgi:hypothetical protein